MLICSSAASVAVLGAAAIVAGGARSGVVFGLAACFTVATSVYMPAEGALMPVVSRTPQELSAANVARSAMDDVGFLIGSIAAGVGLALEGPQLVFGLAAGVALVTTLVLAGVSRDRWPQTSRREEVRGIAGRVADGMRALASTPESRLSGVAITLVTFFEGAADVMVVIVALDLLALGDGAVGYLSAAWGVGALVGGAGLAVLLERGRLASGLLLGSLVIGFATSLPAIWVSAAAAYLCWLGMGPGTRSRR